VTEPIALVDTNICIYIIEGKSDAARARIEQFAPGEVVTSAICYAELMRGLDPADASARAAVKDFFAIIPVLDFDRSAAERFGSIPFRRRSFDRLIAAHALALGVTLVTNNEADFADVPDLVVENWTQP
jgi:tRNA(fMet)-specific endonuclease VapC